MTETLANGYTYVSTQRELSNEYQHDMIWMIFIFSSCALDESSLSIGWVNNEIVSHASEDAYRSPCEWVKCYALVDRGT